jgi:hypothetical protein
MATIKNLNGTTPAAPANSRNATWQVVSSPSGTDPTSGNPVYDGSCYIPDMVGDTGSGGADGLVPAPPAGSAAAGKFLKADGTFAVPPTTPPYTSPLTTKGDLFGHSTVDARIPVGADGTVLTADSTQPLGVKYATPAAPGSSSLIQLLQFKAGTVGSGTITATFTNATQHGSTIIVEYLGTGDLTTVSDTQVDSFTRYNRQSWGGFAFVAQFVATNIVGGTTTITAAGSGQFNLYEYSNVDSVDTSISAQNAGNAPVATGSITTAFPGEVIHMYGAFSTTGGTVSNAAAWPLIQLVTSTSGTTASYNTVQSAAGAISNTFTPTATFSYDYASLLALKPRAIPAGAGTVTSVGLSMPSDFTVSGSPVTSAGTLTVTGGVTKSGIQQEAYTYAADTGTANAYAVAYTPAPTLIAGSAGSFKAANACTGASTLAINGGTAIAIKKNGNSTALASGDIAANQIIDWTYDGTVIQILVAGSGGGGAVSSLTTTGSSGAATLVSGVLNIPVYTGGGGGSAGALVWLGTYNASAVAELDIVTRNATGQSGAIFQSDFDDYEIRFQNIVPATNSVNLLIQCSTNGGSSYDTGSNYSTIGSYYYTGGTGVVGTASNSATAITVLDSISNNTSWGVCGEISLRSPLSTTLMKQFVDGHASMLDAANGDFLAVTFSGVYKVSGSAVNATRFLFASGNIASGSVRVYGISH